MGKSSVEILELVCLSLIACLTLLGNCLVILAFIFGPRGLRTYTHFFVVNLAISDLMVGCLSLPFWLVYRIDPDTINEVIYRYFIALDILCGSVSILSLAAISLERLFAVKFTTLHYNMSKRPVIIAIFVAWTIGILFTGSKFAAEEDLSLKYYTAFLFVLIFLCPLFVIIGSYWLIIHTANKMVRASRSDGNMVQELHVAKTISVIIGLFIVCWAPFFIINMFYVFCENCSIPYWVIYLSKVMHYSNSMMNFFVYAVRSPEFRRTFKRILFRCDCTRVKERVRTISEVVVTRARSASERFSFIHDSNHNHHHNHENGHHKNGHHKKITDPKKTTARRSHRMSFTTEVSMMDETSSSELVNGHLHSPLIDSSPEPGYSPETVREENETSSSELVNGHLHSPLIDSSPEAGFSPETVREENENSQFVSSL